MSKLTKYFQKFIQDQPAWFPVAVFLLWTIISVVYLSKFSNISPINSEAKRIILNPRYLAIVTIALLFVAFILRSYILNWVTKILNFQQISIKKAFWNSVIFILLMGISSLLTVKLPRAIFLFDFIIGVFVIKFIYQQNFLNAVKAYILNSIIIFLGSAVVVLIIGMMISPFFHKNVTSDTKQVQINSSTTDVKSIDYLVSKFPSDFPLPERSSITGQWYENLEEGYIEFPQDSLDFWQSKYDKYLNDHNLKKNIIKPEDTNFVFWIFNDPAFEFKTNLVKILYNSPGNKIRVFVGDAE